MTEYDDPDVRRQVEEEFDAQPAEDAKIDTIEIDGQVHRLATYDEMIAALDAKTPEEREELGRQADAAEAHHELIKARDGCCGLHADAHEYGPCCKDCPVCPAATR